jgi:hypothetical protein
MVSGRWLLIPVVLSILIIPGCLDRLFNNEVFLEVTVESELDYDVMVIVLVNGDETHRERAEGYPESGGRPVSSTGYTMKKGEVEIEVVVEYLDGESMYLWSDKYDLKKDSWISIKVGKSDLNVIVEEIDLEDPPENNMAPALRNGGYEILENGSYLFKVEYKDPDGERPRENVLMIWREVPFGYKDTRTEVFIHQLIQNGTNENGWMEFIVTVEEFDEGDEFNFAFSDGHDIAIAEDDTPFTDP